MDELELKFGLSADALASLRSALRARGARPMRLRARYFDTADGLLARHRMALRLRLEGRRWVQTLKAAGASSVQRFEHEVRIPSPAGNVPALDLALHAGTPAGELLQQLLKEAPGAVLVERYATDVQRLRSLLTDAGGSHVEVALDIGMVTAGERSAPISELEMEHKAGPLEGLFTLAQGWLQHGGLWLSATTKAERGQRLAQAEDGDLPGTPSPASGERTAADGPALLRCLLHDTLAPVLRHGSAVAEGATDADTIHKLRVGLRRLRTLLRELPALSPALSADWDGPLGFTFGQLGQQRDQQAVTAAVRPLLEAAGAPRLTWQAATPPDPAEAVKDSAFQGVLLQALALAHDSDDHYTPLSRKQAVALVAGRLNRLHRQVSRAADGFEQLPSEQQHRVRKQLKRLRYLADMTAGLWPRRALRRYLKALAVAQDALGHHNDVAVAAEAFKADAEQQAEAGFAAGYLQAHLAVTARSARKALQAVNAHVDDAGRFWR